MIELQVGFQTKMLFAHPINRNKIYSPSAFAVIKVRLN